MPWPHSPQHRHRFVALYRVAAAIGMGATVAIAAGCAAASPTSPAPADPQQQRLQFTACMRDHGVKIADSSGSSTDKPPKVDINSPQVQAAVNASKQYLPKGDTTPQSSGPQEVPPEFNLCLQKHGVILGSRIDTHSPQFKSAAKACEKYLRGGRVPGSS